MSRALIGKYRPTRHEFPTGSWAWMIRAEGLGASLDPFLQVDHFRMAHPTFPPHPHAGMSAVTYMFEDAETGFVNRDSLGDRSVIHPGDLHWTQSGAGMLHEEVPQVPGRWAHGFQIFVNLAERHKQAAPQAFHLDNEAMPRVHLGEGGVVKVIVGSLLGTNSPLTPELLTPVNLLELRLEPSASASLPLEPAGLCVFTTVLQGFVCSSGELVHEGESAHFGRGPGESIELMAGPEGAWLMVMSGMPLDEPVFPKGPFVGNTPADVARYARRYQQGEMGTLAPSF